MRKTHHIAGASSKIREGRFHGGTQRRSFLRRSFTGGGLGTGRHPAGAHRPERLPTHINIRAADTGLAKDSVVLLEQIRTLDKHRLRERAGQITPEDQRRVNQALDVSLGLDSY